MSNVSLTPFLNASIDRLLQALLGVSNGGYWRPMPDSTLDVSALKALLTQAGGLSGGDGPPLATQGTFVPAVYLALTANMPLNHGLTLSLAAWHRLMLEWPASDPTGLSIIARASAAALKPGTEVVVVEMSVDEWVQIGPTVHALFGMNSIPEGVSPAHNDLASLHAAIGVAGGGVDQVIADVSPFDDANRFARFGIAINQGPAGETSILVSSALYATLLAMWPDAVDTGEGVIAGGGGSAGSGASAPVHLLDTQGQPIGVVRVPLDALQGLEPSAWVAELARRGIIDPGQVVYTALDADPQSLAAFNASLQANAFVPAFITPEPAGLSVPTAVRAAWLAQVMQAATPTLQQAAAWLDQVRLSLESGPRNDGWVALDQTALGVIDPASWPADHPLLEAYLRLQGAVRQRIPGTTLTGQLDRELAPGEVLEVTVGDWVSTMRSTAHRQVFRRWPRSRGRAPG